LKTSRPYSRSNASDTPKPNSPGAMVPNTDRPANEYSACAPFPLALPINTPNNR
jgi:hypothetical protein